MRTRPITLCCLLFLCAAAPARSQEASAVGAAGQDYRRMWDYIVRSAELMPAAEYAWKPVATVRSFGQILGHLANENNYFCATALGQKSPTDGQDFEKTTDKAALVKALKDAAAYCDAAYRISDRQAMDQTELFGMKGSKMWVLIMNGSHNGEHYGNIVTYFRIKGMVPPSSQGG